MIIKDTLEFNKVLEMLSDFALSDNVKNKLLQLKPYISQKECMLNMEKTTEAVKMLNEQGNAPIAVMTELDKILDLTEKGGLLNPEELTMITTFLSSCNRMISYLDRFKAKEINLSLYSGAFYKLPELYEEITFTIRNNKVDSNASATLRNISRKIEHLKDSITAKLQSILKSKKNIFEQGYVVTRNGIQVLPVKSTYKNQIKGTVIDTSNTGGTVFIEPDSVKKLNEQLYLLQIEEENEIQKILYTLSALVETYIKELKANMEYMEMLDYIFAKGKLSIYMEARPVPVLSNRHIVIKKGRHPLLDKDKCVPLDFEIGNTIDDETLKGIIITGPNTGGKTVALKTVGLLSLMAQSGLHVPVLEGSSFSMNVNVLCDIGDGQSISENLSTFSSHISNIIEILKNISDESLVLLDELGSGTDPKEGMGIAIAILEELRLSNCLFVATTHYPEVKDYANDTKNIINARMEFDKDTLKPLYKMTIGEAGESQAFYIAKKLGLSSNMLKLAQLTAYGYETMTDLENTSIIKNNVGKIQTDNKKSPKNEKSHNFKLGDSVKILTTGEMGIVFNADNENGDVVVQIKNKKVSVNHKRIKLIVSSDELYPDDYDFSILFDSVENRKLRNKMNKKHVEGAQIIVK